MAHVARRCTKTKKNGTPCKAWAVRGSDPPLCGAHRGGAAWPGAPAGNENALKHGAYSPAPVPGTDLGERIIELDRKVKRVSEYIDGHFDKLVKNGELKGLLDAYGRLVSRLGRLARDRLIVGGDTGDVLERDLDEALAIVSEILGLDL